MELILKHLSKLFICLIIFLCTTVSFATQFESPDNLKTLAQDFLTKNITLDPDQTINIQINKSDLPSQLAACATPIQATFPKESSREKINSIQLSCSNPNWSTFIPVNVQIFTKVVVVKNPIASNTPLSADDLDFAQVDINRLYGGYFKDPKAVVGLVSTQILSPGAVLTQKNVRNPQLVHRNQEIDLIARKNTIVVTVKAISKSDGGLNDSITVYNPSSKRTLEAIVIGTNKAEVIS